jgi:hypothetical protein
VLGFYTYIAAPQTRLRMRANLFVSPRGGRMSAARQRVAPCAAAV